MLKLQWVPSCQQQVSAGKVLQGGSGVGSGELTAVLWPQPVQAGAAGWSCLISGSSAHAHDSVKVLGPGQPRNDRELEQPLLGLKTWALSCACNPGKASGH